MEDDFNFDPNRMKPLPRERRPRLTREALDPHNIKVWISIRLDADILEFFKDRAGRRDAAGYETQINNALREFMEREKSQGER